jgi:hypothetical protein
VNSAPAESHLEVPLPSMPDPVRCDHYLNGVPCDEWIVSSPVPRTQRSHWAAVLETHYREWQQEVACGDCDWPHDPSVTRHVIAPHVDTRGIGDRWCSARIPMGRAQPWTTSRPSRGLHPVPAWPSTRVPMAGAPSGCCARICWIFPARQQCTTPRSTTETWTPPHGLHCKRPCSTSAHCNSSLGATPRPVPTTRPRCLKRAAALSDLDRFLRQSESDSARRRLASSNAARPVAVPMPDSQKLSMPADTVETYPWSTR